MCLSQLLTQGKRQRAHIGGPAAEILHTPTVPRTTQATRRPLQKAPDSSDEEGPDEQSVPEGPPAGAAPYRRGSARSSRPTFSPPGSAGALSEYSPRQQDATLTNAYTTQSPAKPKPAPVQRAVVQDQPESRCAQSPKSRQLARTVSTLAVTALT